MSTVLTFTKDSILHALDKIDNNSDLLKGRESQIYDLVYENKFYPPILVLSEANKILGGQELTIRDFNNSTQLAFKHLNNLGFSVQIKETNFSNDVISFLEQSKTGNLRISDYTKSLLGLSVKVSFGQGYQARIPWIAFLGYGNTVQDGIYPVYLYYKDINLLILAYGVSETNKPNVNWDNTNLTSINQFFKTKNLPPPARYKDSFVYKTYDTSNELNVVELNKDLVNLISIYHATFKEEKQSLNFQMESQKTLPQLANSIVEEFAKSLELANLQFDNKLIARFICSLIAKPFVILTGLSGSGKTKLAQAFAKWICKEESQYCIVPIGADWTNREPILGFPNALQSGQYVKPENAALDIILDACQNTDKPYFIILDEMNLSHVERYFADFLSAMESKGKIYFHSESNSLNGVPPQIPFPNNLFLIGTVNIDETTYMFSPKVLDRANVIEFSVSAKEMKSFLQKNPTPNINRLEYKGIEFSERFITYSKDDTLVPDMTSEIATVLLNFFSELKKTGAEFGYRSASEIYRFIAVLNKLEKREWNTNTALDAAIMQKLLPKIHGSRRKLEPILKSLASLCLVDKNDIEILLNSEDPHLLEDSNKVKYSISFGKLRRMYINLISNGFTSYAEA